MSTILLPADASAAHYDFSVALEGRTFGFEMRWNERSGAWFTTISRADGGVLAAGVRLVTGTRLLGRSADPELPPGALLVVDTSDEEREAGRNDLGTRVVLVYVEAES